MMNFEIGNLHPNAPHLFSDLAELLLLTSYFRRSSLHKSDILAVLKGGTISPDEVDDELEQDSPDSVLCSAERNERSERQLENVMTHLAYRSSALRDFYPFDVKDDALLLKSTLSDEQRIYRMLLACSRLRSFPAANGVRQRWAAAFARLSKIALAGLLPQYAAIRIFDANSDDRKSYYSTNLREALKILGRDLQVINVYDAECNKISAQGDAGLDLVGVIDFNDGAASSFAILGQCGAQETEWPSKTLEAHPIRFRHLFQMQFDCPSVMFTPVCFRDATGAWTDNACANGIFLADRGRILNLLDKQKRFGEVVGSTWFSSFEIDFASITPDE